MGFAVNKVVCDRFLSENVSFPLPVPFHQRSILISIFKTALKRRRNLGTLLENVALSEIWEIHGRECFQKYASRGMKKIKLFG